MKHGAQEEILAGNAEELAGRGGSESKPVRDVGGDGVEHPALRGRESE